MNEYRRRIEKAQDANRAGRNDWDGRDVPVDPCCSTVRAALKPIANVSVTFPSVGSSEWHRDQPGFALRCSNGTAVSSWRYFRAHLVERERSAADFFHAALHPCFVVEAAKRGAKGLPRLALYRLRPGRSATFRMVLLDEIDDGLYLFITAYAKWSISTSVQSRIPADVRATCDGYSLRRRDLQPSARPARRWSRSAEVVSPECCESNLGCVSRSVAGDG